MSGSNVTTTSNGFVTITATSPVTQSIISAVFAAVAAPGTTSTLYGPTSTSFGGGTVLYVQAGATGLINAPTNFSDILIDQNAVAVTVTGGAAGATVIGDSFTYSGSAAVVASGDGIASVIDNANGAQIAFGSSSTITANGSGNAQFIQLGDGGTGSITSSGSATTVLAGISSTTTIVANGIGETIDISNGAKTTVNLIGGDTINIGTGAPTAAAPAALSNAAGVGSAVPVSVTSVNSMTGSGNVYNIAANASGFATANVVLQLGTSDTVNVAGGIDSIFGMASDLVNNKSGSVDFVGQTSASTIFGGTGQTTVFAVNGSQVFNVGTATGSSNTNTFVGGVVASTINAGTGGGVFFGGSHGDLYNIGTSSVQTFVGTGGNDTVNGTAGSVAPTLFAVGTDHMQLTNTPNLTVVAFEGAAGSTVAGAGGSVDASATTFNNVFFTGYGSTGNETLIGSTATIGGTHDVFEVGAASLGGAAASSVPANITITNWHSGDAFFLIGYNAADVATMDAATSVSAQPGASSQLSFTLSDNTKVTFVGSHPTGFNATANAIF